MRCAISMPPPISIGGLGFTVGARNRHPPAWGTQNHIVQFPGVFIELLAIGDTTRIAPHAPRHFSFGAFNRDFLARGEGLSMLVLEGRGAPTRKRFAPPASAISICSSSRARAGARTARRSRSRSRWPSPAIRRRPTSASSPAGTTIRRISGIRRFRSMPTRLPASPAWCWSPRTRATITSFSSAFTGQRDLLATSAGITIEDAARRNPGDETRRPSAIIFGTEPPERRRGARLAALRFAVRDMALAERLLEGAVCPRDRAHGPPRRRSRRRAGRDAGIRGDLSVDPATGGRHVPAEGRPRTAHER